MEHTVHQFFSEEILLQAAALFNAKTFNCRLLGDFENYIYEVTYNGEPHVLRLTYSSHREREQIEAELSWVQFLKREGISVSAPVLSANGRLAEVIPVQEKYFTASLFTKAPGCQVDVHSETFDKSLFEGWGETIGKMHEATCRYTRSDTMTKRMNWEEEELAAVEKAANREPFLIEKVRKITEKLHFLPVEEKVYGLIHCDLHPGNFFWDGKKMTVFDFDDCCYHWFVNDFAIPLYYAVLYRCLEDGQREREEFAEMFFSSFVQGYWRQHELDPWWFGQIRLFLMLRDITFYSALRLKLSEDELTPRWCRIIDQARMRIEQERPIVDLDYKGAYERAGITYFG